MSHTNNSSDLEYNDGLGDLLKERVRHPFNWIKFSLIMCGGISLVLVFVVCFFKIGAFAFQKRTTPITAAKELATIERELPPVHVAPALIKPEAPTVNHKKSPVTSSPTPVTPVKNREPSRPLLPYKVIAASFSNKDKARGLVSILAKRGLSSFVWTRLGTAGSASQFVVQVGAFSSTEEAELATAKLTGSFGIHPTIIIQ